MNDDTLNTGRKRLTQVFRYLEALNHHRNPAKRHLDDQLWRLWFRDLPDHPSIRVASLSELGLASASGTGPKGDSEAKTEGDFVLRVRRPKLTPCPPPPDALSLWLEKGWQDIASEIRVRPTRNELDKEGRTVIVRFEDDPSRQRNLERWRTLRESWQLNERPAREAMRIFEQLYEIRGQIEREGEKVELVLGDGILSWRRNDGGVYHPVVLQRVQLEFDPTIPEFSIVESERPVELYSALFQSMPDVEGKVLARVRQELEDGKFHPLGREDTSGLLRSLVVQLSARGEFYPDSAPKAQSDDPVMGRSPVILLRHRNLGFAVAIQSVLENLAADGSVPTSLMRIVGIDDAPPPTTESPGAPQWFEDSNPVDVLLSKPANPEQVRIAQRLEQHGSVLVQGPPGTGKTHTIANLIGHLLAEGKSILVASHTSKALRVVRDQVVRQLRPLCVSVLDSDMESRKQLESSVDEIVSRLSRNDANQLEQVAEGLQKRREALIGSLRELANSILNARADEYREIVVGGEAVTPSEAARMVYVGRESLDYIPCPVELGSPLPLSDQELSELYATNESVSLTDETELRGLLPNPKELLLPAEFDALIQERNELAKHDFRYRTDLWESLPRNEHLEALEDFSAKVRRAADFINKCEAWQLAVMLSGYYGGNHRKPWESFLAQVDETWTAVSVVQDSLIEHDPQLPEGFSLEQSLAIGKEIYAHVEKTGSVSFLTLLTRASWKKFIRGSRVGNIEPRLPEHFAALHGLAEVTVKRTQLIARWTKQMIPLGGPASELLGPTPEQAIRQFSSSIRKCLDWYSSEWEPLEAEGAKIGLRFRQLLEEQPSDLAGGELKRLAKLLNGPLQEVLAARCNLIRWNAIESKLAQLRDVLGNAGGDTQSTTVVERLREALTRLDSALYRNAVERLNDLFTRRKDLERRRELLRKLTPVAPGWAEAIRKRNSIHGAGKVPDRVREAWRWRQFNDELDRRGKVSLEDLQHRSERIGKDIRDVTAELIERQAWAAQLRRTERNLQQKQALVGWLDTVKKIGKGTGIRAPKLRAQANRLMSDCRGAVPVWIMPLSRVAENFDPRTTRFDVVIIDEASQADVMALLALFLAQKSVVVGDHEQVSPSAVGQDLGVVEHLIDEFLEGIPNRHLYDEKTSIYDLARQSFGGTIRLVEHFRCVPEIIQFSNQLSYEGAIRPLRDASKVELKPHVIAHRVTGALSFGKENTEEAEEIAALVVAASEEPEYADKTFGIISLVGDEQAYKIDLLLRRHLSEEEFKLQHNILCGNPAQFQGDERDVVFLSVVDTSDGGVLRLREEPMFKQRFNVAASRARDQMWVVHSIDPRSHLKPGDLRRRLIEYSEDPYRVLKALENIESATESPFEREVAARLVRSGFKVIPQWRVGHYRIDLVVEGSGRRIAIECDGDKFHPIERLADDMARQAVLERLGWTFVRVRGSQFFRQPEEAMRFIFEKLRGAGIEPQPLEERQEEPSSLGRELIERVIRRAHEIRREWKESNGGAHVRASAVAHEDQAERLVFRMNVPLDETGVDGDFVDDEEFTLSGPGTPRLLTKDIDADSIRAAIGSNLPASERIERELLLRQCAQALGFSRLSKNLRSRLNKTIGAEVRYGRIQVDSDWRYLWRQ
jgi:very-short-patch-repair endonuclease